jgi:ribosomal protein S16
VRAGDQRQPLLLLLLGAEQEQRLGHADRLVGREQRAERRVPHVNERERAVVVHLREAEAAVALGHLHPQRPELLEPVHHVVRDLRLALDAQRIDLGLEEGAQPGEEALALLHRLRVQARLGVDQVEAEAPEEQLLAEARQLPLALAGLLGDLPGLALG